MRFAQEMDEFQSAWEPGIESPISANLLKGTTVFNFITGGMSPLNWQLRLLEGEGVINVVNGPLITVLDGESAQFVITRFFGTGTSSTTSSSDTGTDNTDGDTSGQSGQEEGDDTGTTSSSSDSLGGTVGSLYPSTMDQVDMEVTPEITSEDSIILEIDVVLEDFESNLGEVVFLSSPITDSMGPRAVANTAYNAARRRKEIETIARVKDGGTIVLGSWTGERAQEMTSGVPVLRNLPYIGRLFFGRNKQIIDKTNLMIFLTARLVD